MLYRYEWGIATMSWRSFGAFGPEAIAEMTEALQAACHELRATGQPDEVAREIIATRIPAAVKVGERDPARLLEAALRRSD
jgi:hypothetical protein